MICPYCNCKFLSRHVPFCSKRDLVKNRDELRAFYLEFNFPELFKYEKLVEVYINSKMSLPDIRHKFNIDYKNIQFMLRFYKIPVRGHSDGAIFSMDKRENTNIERYGEKNVLSKGTIKYQKRNKTVKEKYGVDNIFQVPEIIEKIQSDTNCLEKNGMTRSELISINAKKFWSSLTDAQKYEITKNFFGENSRKKSRKTRIENGLMLSDEELDPFKLYRRNCRRLTKRNKKQLFKSWNGYDYYDGEYIKENLLLDHIDNKYPTIDHKISIYNGFKNGIPEIEICSINNLCITKRGINSSKGIK